MKARERYKVMRREADIFHGITRALYRAWERRERRKAYRRYMNSEEWKNIKAVVRVRAKGKCERCGRFAMKDVHHLVYHANLFETTAAECQAVCAHCHPIADAERRKGRG